MQKVHKCNNSETTKMKIVQKDVDHRTIIPINLRGGKIERVCCGYLCQTDRHTTVYHNTSYLKMEYNLKKKISLDKYCSIPDLNLQF